MYGTDTQACKMICLYSLRVASKSHNSSHVIVVCISSKNNKIGRKISATCALFQNKIAQLLEFYCRKREILSTCAPVCVSRSKEEKKNAWGL